ncbi:hypothetical protein HZS_716 [Henneguya salminicola]|nr:hypothetical protein HZS_716 [Henneguya salminicola]
MTIMGKINIRLLRTIRFLIALTVNSRFKLAHRISYKNHHNIEQSLGCYNPIKFDLAKMDIEKG